MRARWILATSILVLTLIPGALRAAEATGCAPAAATAAITNAAVAEPVSAAPDLLPVWSGLPAQNFTPQAPQGNDPNPLFLASCSGCTPTQCARLHSCVLMHCC